MVPLIERLWLRGLEWFLPILVAVIDTSMLTWIWLVHRVGLVFSLLLLAWGCVVLALAVGLLWTIADEGWSRVRRRFRRWRIRRELRAVKQDRDTYIRATALTGTTDGLPPGGGPKRAA